MEEFEETLKELEDILQKQEEAEAEALQKQKHAKKMRNYITETTEKIEGCVIICILKNNNCFLDAFAKKINSDDFFTKIFEYVKLKHYINITLCMQRRIQFM